MKYMKIITIAFVAVFALLITPISDVEASRAGGGKGGDGRGGGTSAKWHFASGKPYSGSGTTAAWKTFSKTVPDIDQAFRYKKLHPAGFSSRAELKRACQRSQYIWWFGDNDRKKRWRQHIGNGMHPAKTRIPGYTHNFDTVAIINQYMTLHNHGWGKAEGTVVICSAGVIPPDRGGSVEFTANSGTFLYNGKTHKVNGYKLTKGKLNSGHKISVKPKASGSRRSVGSGSVTFKNNVRIVNSSGKNITSLYSVRYKPGTIKVVPRLTGPGERCKTTSSETVYKNTQNQATISEGYAPAGAKGKYNVGSTAMYNNKAYQFTRSYPKGGGIGGDTKAKWNNWKKQLNAIPNDSTTNSISLQGNVADVLQKHGGVIDVTRTNYDTRFNVTFCQPQERSQYLDKNNTAKWTKWKNKGKERIQTITRKDKSRSKKYSYQILGVNCNAKGLSMVKSKYDTIDLSHGEAGGLVQTKPKAGLHFPLGKAGDGIGTNKDSFYNPDGTDGWVSSCKEAFKDSCVSTKLSESAKNDANNNLGSSPKFTHEDKDLYKDNNPKGHAQPSENGELNFFRDNVERTVRADVWYLDKMTKNGYVTNPDNLAKKTTARVFAGTPEAEITDIIPIEIDNTKGSKLLNSNRDMGKDIVIDNHMNKLGVKSKWASDSGKPYEIGLNWTYRAAVENVGPNRVDGHKVINATGKKTFEFDAQCTFQNDNSKYPANIPNNPFLDDGSSIKPKWDGSGKIKTLFTRSVSDKVTEDGK